MHAACEGQQRAAKIRQGNAPPAPFEQSDAILRLQRLHLHGDRGLADAQAPGGGSETALGGGSVEGAEAGTIHKLIICILSEKGIGFMDGEKAC